MKLAFSLRTTADFFIRGWRIDTYLGLSVTMLLILMVGLIFEGFQSVRYVHMQSRTERYRRCISTKQRPLAIRTHVERSLLTMLHVMTGYLLMLCAMSYNVWIMISVIVGAGVGYLFIRPAVQHWLEQKTKDSEKEGPGIGESSEVKVKFLNGVNGKAGEPKLEITDGEKKETCT